jgi:Rrf2 family protein
MVDLAECYALGPIPLGEIAKRQDLSAKYLEQLIILLRAVGLIKSERGRRGGYMLARKPEEISVGEIVEALEGGLALSKCVTESGDCQRSPRCPTRRVWADMTDLLKEELYATSLQDILDKSGVSGRLQNDSDS